MSILHNLVLKRFTSQEDLNPDDLIFEEKHADAIYQVTYRKVYNHAQQPTQTYDSSPTAHSSNGLVYSKIKIKQIKFGTVEKLITSFTNDHGELDSNTTCTFLATYRTFTNAKDVLKILFKKYQRIFPASLEMTEEIRVSYIKSFRSIITTWMDSYSEDFDEPPAYENLMMIMEYCLQNVPDNTDMVNYLNERLKSFVNRKKIKDQQILNQINAEKQEKFERIIKSENENKNQFKKMYNSKSEVDLANIKIVLKSSTGDREKYAKTEAIFKPIPPATQQLTTKKSHQRSMSNTSLSHVGNDVPNNKSFMEADEHYVAEQLTYIDKELFQKVLPYHCLGAVWSTRKKLENKNFETINLFIEQFNVITFIVQGTILEYPEDFRVTSYKRAKIIEKWIRIALHLRNYKNFSSLNAVVQGLDTQCISRLQKTWNDVSNEYKNHFNELIELFSQDNNQKLFRETLMKDPIGTIPFLGTFLRDLEYIHAQNPTRNDNGLINFAKKRKEFEIIAQIKLLQRAAQFYKIDMNPNFKKWLSTLPSYNEETNYEYSYLIEPRVIENEPSINKTCTYSTNGNIINMTKPSFSSSRCESSESINSGIEIKTNYTNTMQRKVKIGQHSRQSSNTSSDIYLSNSLGSGSLNGLSVDGMLPNGNPINSSANSFQSYSPTTSNSNGTPQTPASKQAFVAKVNVVDPNLNDTVCYKKIFVKDSDRCKEVKRSILSKFHLDPDKADKYTLIQTFNDGVNKDLLIVNDCNVFYAAKRVNDIQFVLKVKETSTANGATLTHNQRNSESKFFTFANASNTKTFVHKNKTDPAALPPPAPNSNRDRPAWDVFRNILS